MYQLMIDRASENRKKKLKWKKADTQRGLAARLEEEKKKVVYRVPAAARLWTELKRKPRPHVHMRCSYRMVDREKKEKKKTRKDREKKEKRKKNKRHWLAAVAEG
jgi:hypothetical protein